MAGASLALPALLSSCGSSSPPGGAEPTPTPTPTPTPDAFPVPPLLDGDLQNGVRVFPLELRAGTVDFGLGAPTATYGVNGAFLGPTLRFRRGERVRLEVTNALPDATTLHGHGMQVPASADGGPYQPIAPGTTWVAEYDVVQRALTAWYHPHQMHETARQVYMGLAGLIHLEDPASPFDLPSTYGIDDIPLVFQDRRFFADGTHPYSDGGTPSQFDLMAGLKGETVLVNGRVELRGPVPRGLTRFRVLNASNARNYNLGFSDGRTFLHIASDGGLLAAPFATNRALLGPGERAEILVDFSADPEGSAVTLRSYSGEVLGELFSGGPGANFADDFDRGTFDVATFEVGAPPPAVIVPPASFQPITRMVESDAVRTRQVQLSMAAGSVFLNGAQMTALEPVPAAISFEIPSGDVELWVATNTSGMAHPLHLHHRQFQVLDIDGAPPPAPLAGWKDTVLVPPGGTVRLLMLFEGPGDADIPYMFHCHILEHEDHGMMGRFFIVDP